MGGLTTIWRDKGIKLATKVKLVKASVFPIVLCGNLDDEKSREEEY